MGSIFPHQATAEQAKTEELPQWIRIHNTLAKFPWSKAVNPHQEECSRASHAWLASFGMLSPKALATAWKGQNGYLASLAWPQLSQAGCQIGCDLMNMYWILDGTTDRCASAAQAKVLVDCFMHALRSHPDPSAEGASDSGEWELGAVVAREFMQRMKSFGATEPCMRRFVSAMQVFCDGVVEQAGDRSRDRVRDVETYFEVRRRTIGVYPCYVILQLDGTMEMADDVRGHEIVQRLEQLAADMIILDNDLLSYNKEQATGDEAHNLVRVVMNQFGLGLQAAIDYIGEYHERLMEEFLEVYGQVSVVFPGDEQVRRYAWGVGNWVRANWQWSWETGRYFPNNDGLMSLEQRDGLVALLPRETTC